VSVASGSDGLSASAWTTRSGRRARPARIATARSPAMSRPGCSRRSRSTRTVSACSRTTTSPWTAPCWKRGRVTRVWPPRGRDRDDANAGIETSSRKDALSVCVLTVSVGVSIVGERIAVASIFQTFNGKRGEPGGNRTHNPQIKSLLLCQLSYRPEGMLGTLGAAKSRRGKTRFYHSARLPRAR
jgi:hypothetical protein